MQSPKKLRVLCIHSWRTSGRIFQEQIERSNFTGHFQDLVSLEFIDAPHVAEGPVPEDVAKAFEGPYYEWWTSAKEEGVWHYSGWQESVEYIEAHMQRCGPFDGVMGFSQGGAMTTLLAAYQQHSLLHTDTPAFKFAMLIAGFVPRAQDLTHLFEAPLTCPSLHLIGEKDFLKVLSAKLVDQFTVSPTIWHPYGHVVPRMTDSQGEVARHFLLGMISNSSAV